MSYFYSGLTKLSLAGFLHSETAGSKVDGTSPTSIAAVCVLPRPESPRHPLLALISILFPQSRINPVEWRGERGIFSSLVKEPGTVWYLATHPPKIAPWAASWFNRDKANGKIGRKGLLRMQIPLTPSFLSSSVWSKPPLTRGLAPNHEATFYSKFSVLKLLVFMFNNIGES